ncbi:uncharacterized protein LOC122721798 [Manihot esculenta]|uniref:uncharacterized protein LOC122721798 n=1 Tax=Manihot esculenta TaxID=3983 RepID=UPI001CC44AFE|nr:uncharacterized protein LOC122721798 [Manihot esculenta]
MDETPWCLARTHEWPSNYQFYISETNKFAFLLIDQQHAPKASDSKMDQIKPPKNLILSRESMDAALDILLVGRSVGEATQKVAETISSRSAIRPPPPPPVSSQASKPSSRRSRSSRPSSQGRSSSAHWSIQAPQPQGTSNEGTEEGPMIISEVAEGVGSARSDLVLPTVGASGVSAAVEEEVPGGRLEVPIMEEGAPGKRAEVILVDEDVSKAPTNDALAPEEVGSDLAKDGGVTEKVGDKRPASLEMPAPAPARKKSRASKGSAPALPPIGEKKEGSKESTPVLPPPEKKKDVPVIPLLSAPDNDILNAEDITHQSPASVVAEIVKERMFGGVMEALDPRLLALTGLLASSTREQAAFRSRPRGELGDTIREMLLMVTGLFMEVDARDHSLRESVDRRIEEARLEENLSATSDARGNLAVARVHTQSLQAELHSALEALKRADGKAAEAQEHAKSLEAELFHTHRVLKESDERAAAAEVRCEEVLKQLSSMVETLREKDEAMSQKDEVQCQYEALKADFEGAQAHLDKVKVQKEGALARVEVLEQELSRSSERIRDLALSAEESKLHNQELSQEVGTLEHKCSALLEEAKHVEDMI